MDKENEREIFDRLKFFDNISGDRDLLKTLCSQFLHTHSTLFDDIRAAVSNKNAASLAAAAHKLKGSFATFYAERAYNAAVVLEEIGKTARFEKIDTALSDLEQEVKALATELEKEIQRDDNQGKSVQVSEEMVDSGIGAAISHETTEAADAISRKKGDVLDLVEELRISVETTCTLKTAIQHRMDDLETKIDYGDEELAKLREEFGSFREAIRDASETAPPPVAIQEMVAEINDKISAIEKEFIGEKEGLALTRKDMVGITGMLKDFRKIFLALVSRFTSHILEYHQKKSPSGDAQGGTWVRKYNLNKIKPGEK